MLRETGQDNEHDGRLIYSSEVQSIVLVAGHGDVQADMEGEHGCMQADMVLATS